MIRICIIILALSINALGFDKDLCHDHVYILGPSGGSGFLSSTEFTSSFGECSGVRKAKINKITSFVLINRERLKNDLARKSDEVISSFLQTCECNIPGQNYIKNYFLRDLESKISSSITDDQIKSYLEDKFRSDKTLYYGCLVYNP